LPISGINFITCHDGFTLNDLFSYNQKHNIANGEDNRDGCNNSLSFNCGIEGETKDPAVIALRKQSAKNAYAILLVSLGVPMLLAGDEFLNSQQGNNNSYCQDNPLSWLDWQASQDNADILRFVQLMIQLRKRHPALMRRNFLNGEAVKGREIADITWYGEQPDQAPNWDTADNRFIAYTLAAIEENEADLHIVMNMSDDILKIQLPKINGRQWHLSVDTGKSAPVDIIEFAQQKPLAGEIYQVSQRSVVVFEAKA
jgi:glycogen operon protein